MVSFVISKKNIIIAIFMLVAVLTRLVPHLPNFTPVTAIALFGGLYISNRILAYALPLVIMLISDLFVGFSSITLFVYAAFLIVTSIGMLRKKPSIFTIFLGSLSFFIVTNFGVWILGYPKTWTGLAECYTLALPFFRNSLWGDFFYSGIMIVGFNFVQKHYLQKVK
ncbi:MAG: Uncharacterised protein [Formosa sp. Hel3_A1_48]|nr:MAG: Uncharacterised protein [Formosa sp. Hel3_A1_48]